MKVKQNKMNNDDFKVDLYLLSIVILIFGAIGILYFINYKIGYMYQLETGCN